jgi:tetratricopeptide (TPR) repeat protein
MHQDNAGVVFEHGLAYLNEGRYPAALLAFTHALELDDTFVPAYVERGMLLLQSHDFSLATEDFERAIHIDPRCGRAYLGRGWVHYHMGDYEGALRAAYLGIEHDLDHLTPYEWLLGAVYRATDGSAHALEIYTRIIRRQPEHVEAYYYRAIIQLESPTSSAQGFADLDHILTVRPAWLPALALRSSAYLTIKKPKLALKDLDTIIQHHPDYAPAYRQRSAVYTQLNRHSKAYRDFIQAGLLDYTLRQSHHGLWIFAHPFRVMIAIIATIMLGLFIILMVSAPEISPRTLVTMDGQFVSLSGRENGSFVIQLTDVPYDFEIGSSDLAFFDVQAFVRDVQPGEFITLSMLRTAYEIRDERRHIQNAQFLKDARRPGAFAHAGSSPWAALLKPPHKLFLVCL